LAEFVRRDEELLVQHGLRGFLRCDHGCSCPVLRQSCRRIIKS
jgi:hypothetical protein